METKIPVFDNCSISGSGQNNFLAMDLEQYIHQHADMVFPHRHSFYHLVLFTGGKGNFTIDFTNFTIEPFLVYLMSPGQVHTWDFDNIPQGFVINFANDYFQSLLLNPDYIGQFGFFNGNAADNVLEVMPHKQDRVVKLLSELVAESSNYLHTNEDLSKLMLLQFFHLLDKQSGNPSNVESFNAGQALLDRFKNLVEQHFKTEKFPSFYADQLSISSNHLNNICKMHLGRQAGEFVRERIVLEAKRLLVNPAISISSLSSELNFSDNSYFTKFFKKQVGMTPENFRKEHAVYPSFSKLKSITQEQ